MRASLKKRIERIIPRLNFVGLAVGFLFYCFSLTPSLLPRPAVFEGLLAGVSFAIGYAIGVGISWIIRRFFTKEPPPHVKKIVWRLLFAVMLVVGVAYALWAVSWQNEVRRLVGEDEFEGQHILTLVLLAYVTAAFFITAARLIYRTIHIVSKQAERWLPRRLSYAIGTGVVVLVMVWFFNGVLFKAFVSIANSTYRGTNNLTKAGVLPPTSPLRSGSDISLVPWETLGRQGRSFVGTGPTVEQLTAFSGQPGTEPIRVYVGLQSAPSIEERAELAVAELERTGAFERDVLCVMTATGTGWIEAQSADSLEYMWNGNTALVSIQYSYLPSWISFLVDKQNATDAGRLLFNTVYKKWQALPENERPQLIVYGMSLGSYGGQAAFSGVEDLQNRTDGALFIGTPNDSEPWREFTARRDSDSPEWLPIYRLGQTVRFAALADHLARPATPWSKPRIVFLQHASDPIVWWSPSLIWHEPDWLKESRGPDVSPKVQWYPFVTFFQISVDQFFGTTVPHGHGHNYANMIVSAWAAVVPPDNWTPEKTTQLQALIDAYSTNMPSKTK